jgi:hypothetical protein
MANPGYPMQPPPGGMGPMGGMPPMGMPPGMGPGGMRPMRRGTSKAVPVVVSAGLAVGVFCGLLFGLGTGGDDATAATSSEKKDQGSGSETPDILMAKPGESGTTQTPAKPKQDGAGSAGSGSAVAATGSGAAGSAGSAAPAAKTTKLVIEIKPEAAAQVAKITVDGKDTPAISDFEMGDAAKKKVVIIIKASGFKDVTFEGDVEGQETKFAFEMQKKPKPSGGGGALPRPETPSGSGSGKKPGTGKKPGGLIDI